MGGRERKGRGRDAAGGGRIKTKEGGLGNTREGHEAGMAGGRGGDNRGLIKWKLVFAITTVLINPFVLLQEVALNYFLGIYLQCFSSSFSSFTFFVHVVCDR